MNNLKQIIEERKGCLIRGYEGTAKLSLAVEYLVDIFNKSAENNVKNTAEALVMLDKWNYHRIKMEFMDRMRSGNRNNSDRSSHRGGYRKPHRTIEQINPRSFERFTKEALSASNLYWDMIETIDEHYIKELCNAANKTPDKKYYLVVEQADMTSHLTLSNAISNRNTPYYHERIDRIIIPDNIYFILISDEIYSDPLSAKVFNSVVVEINYGLIEDKQKKEALKYLNQRLDVEIKSESVQLGESYFMGNESISQAIIDIEPILFNLLPEKTENSEGKIIFRKEILNKLSRELKEKFPE